MKIYVQRELWKEYKWFLWKEEGNAILFLSGVNIEGATYTRCTSLFCGAMLHRARW